VKKQDPFNSIVEGMIDIPSEEYKTDFLSFNKFTEEVKELERVIVFVM